MLDSNFIMSSSSEQTNLPSKSAESSKSTKSAQEKKSYDIKKRDPNFRPSTPPRQTGSRLQVDDGNSPSSEACASGAVTPMDPREVERLRKEHQKRDPRP